MNVLLHQSSPSAVSLMRDVLREGRDFTSECPLVFAPSAPGRIVTVEDERGEVLSTCAILERRLIAPTGSWRAGLIGSVATHPDHRERGYGGEVLAEAERRFTEGGCLLALLWADDPQYYQSRGWVPIGLELDYVLRPEHLPALPEPTNVREATPADGSWIHALYLGHSARVERSESETLALLRSPAMRTLVRERAGRVVAYACCGRGEDLQNVVHEWAGEAQDVLALLRAHCETASRAGARELVLMVPPTREELARYFEIAGIPGRKGILGMGKLLSLEGAAQLFQQAGGAQASCRVHAGHLRLAGPAGTLDMDPTEALLALLPPRGDRGVVDALERETGLTLASLPLAPFVWGLDSI